MSFAERLRSALPERMKEQARFALARRLERQTRESDLVRGAALVIHAVGPVAGDGPCEIDPPIAASRLEAWVAYLARRYVLVRAAELLAAARDRSPGERIPIALTFDDDLQSHLDYAAPILTRHGVVATAFLCSPDAAVLVARAAAGNRRRSARSRDLPGLPSELTADALARRPWAIGRLAKAIEELQPDRRATVALVLSELVPDVQAPLDAAGARALCDAGWEIGFHTQRHDLLLQLDDASLAGALRDGSERLPVRPRTLAYPHGKAGTRESTAARAAGYEAAFTGVPEVVTERSDPHLVGRLQPDTATNGKFALQLARALAVSKGRAV